MVAAWSSRLAIMWFVRTIKSEAAAAARTGARLGARRHRELAIDIATEELAGGIAFDFFCASEVYGNCIQLRGLFEDRGQAHVLRVPRSIRLTLASDRRLTGADAASMLAGKRWPEVRSAGKAPPPSPRPPVSPAHTTHPRRRNCPGQPLNGCCPSRRDSEVA